MLNIQHRNLGTVSLLKLEGQFVIGETDALIGVMESLPPASSVILDLSQVRRIDAHGLGVMLQVREQAQARGAELKLTNASTCIREVLRITRLDSVFYPKYGVEFLPLAVESRWDRVAA